ncbi:MULTISPECIES: hypothetical protein [Acinetobacter]|uniref:hypothetical protein n=1 Tax=Acinetobacter TaxID=469 RepID=UPI0002FE1481|nr:MULTISPECIES: hypothetical protein [Acinetobacter]
MYIKNIETFPIITLSYKSKDQQSLDELFESFTALLAKNEKFVFISEGAFDEAEQNNDHESRKRIAAWVKAKRETLSRFVLGLVHIEPDLEQRTKAEQFAKVYLQFSGYPMYVVSSKEESDQLVYQLLHP